MYPLANWVQIRRGYRFLQWTFYGARHRGVDYLVSAGTPVYAPFDGEVVAQGYTPQQGNYVHFIPEHDNVYMRFMHFRLPGRGVGKVKQGELLGYVGSTGLSTGPHLHLDISRNRVELYDISNFIDPDIYNWGWSKPTPAPKPPSQPTGDFWVVMTSTGYVRTEPNLNGRIVKQYIGNGRFRDYLIKDERFLASAVVTGQTVSGNPYWIQSKKGNFVWSGNCKWPV